MNATKGRKIFCFFENVKPCACKLVFPFLKLKQLNLKNSRILNSLVKWKNLKKSEINNKQIVFFHHKGRL